MLLLGSMDEQIFSFKRLNHSKIRNFYLSLLIYVVELEFQLVYRLLVEVNVPEGFNVDLELDDCS